jgi:glycosyltransferase domain-containing protein
MNWKNEITIIIPTHNRHKYLNRILDYYKGENFNILIADSSNDKYTQKVSGKTKYYHYPCMDYCQKMFLISQKIKTKYSVLCADDDFIIPNSIRLCILFLNQNQNYGSCQGHMIYFKCKNKKIKFRPSYTLSYGNNFKIDNKNWESRLIKVIDLQPVIFYSVFKTEIIKKNFNMLNNLNIKYEFGTYGLIEDGFRILSILQFHHKILPILYYIRELNKNSSTENNKSFIKMIKKKDLHHNIYINWKKSLINSISKITNNDSKYILSLFNKAISLKKRRTPPLINRLYNQFNHFLPYNINQFMSELYLCKYNSVKKLWYPSKNNLKEKRYTEKVLKTIEKYR